MNTNKKLNVLAIIWAFATMIVILCVVMMIFYFAAALDGEVCDYGMFHTYWKTVKILAIPVAAGWPLYERAKDLFDRFYDWVYSEEEIEERN